MFCYSACMATTALNKHLVFLTSSNDVNTAKYTNSNSTNSNRCFRHYNPFLGQGQIISSYPHTAVVILPTFCIAY